MLKTDIVVVTAKDRHDWICKEFSKMGLSAVVLDVTESLGPWAPEDWEGPFGLFKSERLAPSQLEVLEQDADIREVRQGFTIWTRQGPIELRGPLSAYQFEKNELDPISKDYVAASEHIYRQSLLEEERAHLSKQEYKKSWLAHLAHTFASPTDKEFPESLRRGHGLPLFAPYFVRKPKRKTTVQHRKPLEEMGHFYHQMRKIQSLDVNDKKLAGIECETFNAENSSVKVQKFEANYFVWLLSRQETEFLNSTISSNIFASPTSEPYWTWTRFRFHFKPCRLLDAAPDAFAVVDDLFLSWTHENFLIFNRADKSWDVWLKIAYHRKSDKSYLQALGQLIELQMQKKIAGLSLAHIEYPQTFHYEDLAPSPFVIYEKGVFTQLAETKFSDFFFGGVESQKQLDWTGFFERQNEILRDIITDMISKRDKNSSQPIDETGVST